MQNMSLSFCGLKCGVFGMSLSFCGVYNKEKTYDKNVLYNFVTTSYSRVDQSHSK